MQTRQTHDLDTCPPYVDHARADELREIDCIFEETPELVELVFLDLVRGEVDPDLSARRCAGVSAKAGAQDRRLDASSTDRRRGGVGR